MARRRVGTDAMDVDLRGETALVTGGAVRIGRVIALRLAAAGASVVIHCNTSRKEAQALRKSIAKNGGSASVVRADLAKPKQRAALLAAAAKAAGKPVTLLVNNAAPYPKSTLETVTARDFASAADVIARAPHELALDLAARLPPRRRGAVVNILDARIVDSDPQHVAYLAAKRMLAELTRRDAVELAPRVTVNAVAPGPVLGPPGDKDYSKRMARFLPLRRTPTPEDVADAVAWLLAAPSITGQILFVDGGRHLGRAGPR